MADVSGSEKPITLVSLCAEFICRNLNKFTAKSPDGTPFLRTPFVLPVVIVETLLFKLNELFIRNENAIATLLHPSTCPQGLRRLRIPGNVLGPTGVDLASKNCHLVDVNLAFCRQLTDQKIIHGLLPSSRTLRVLNLGHIKGRLGFEELESFTVLRELDLCATDVDLVSLKRACAQMKRLQSLDVSETSISTLLVLTSVSHLSGLRSLSVHGLSLEEDKEVELRAVLGEVLKNLTFLDVSRVQSKKNPSTVDLLSIIFSQNSSLKELDISGCWLPLEKLVSMITPSPMRNQLEVLVLIANGFFDRDPFLTAVQSVAPQLCIAALDRTDATLALQPRYVKRPFHLRRIFTEPEADGLGQRNDEFQRMYGELALLSSYCYFSKGRNDALTQSISLGLTSFLRLKNNDYLFLDRRPCNHASTVERCIDFAVNSLGSHWDLDPLEPSVIFNIVLAARFCVKWSRRIGSFLVDVTKTLSNWMPPLNWLGSLVLFSSADVCSYIAFECGAALLLFRNLSKVVAHPVSFYNVASLSLKILVHLTDAMPTSGDEIVQIGPDVDPVQCVVDCIDELDDRYIIQNAVDVLANVALSPRGLAAVVKNPRAVNSVLGCLDLDWIAWKTAAGDKLAISVCQFMAAILSDDLSSFWLQPGFPSRERVCRLLGENIDRLELKPSLWSRVAIPNVPLFPLLKFMKCSHAGIVRYFGLWRIASLCVGDVAYRRLNYLDEDDQVGIATAMNLCYEFLEFRHCCKFPHSLPILLQCAFCLF